eukprot:scaffold18578_cov122-Amphora_coffeaeformis.AAC.1
MLATLPSAAAPMLLFSPLAPPDHLPSQPLPIGPSDLYSTCYDPGYPAPEPLSSLPQLPSRLHSHRLCLRP